MFFVCPKHETEPRQSCRLVPEAGLPLTEIQDVIREAMTPPRL